MPQVSGEPAKRSPQPMTSGRSANHGFTASARIAPIAEIAPTTICTCRMSGALC